MKIAICLSGINNVCDEFLKHFLSSIMHTDADLHIHSWNNVGENQKIQDIFPNIKSLVLEEQNEKLGWHYAMTDPWVNPLNTVFQLYGISKSFCQALNSNVKYDIYIRCRFDVFVGNKINYKNLNSEYTHMLPNGRPQPPRVSQIFQEKIKTSPLPKDFFWICGQKDAEISARLFDNAEKNNIYENITMVGEDLIFHHFAKNEVKIKLLEDNQVNGLYRHANHPHGDGLIIYDSFGFKKHN